jgi:hypothetical protein
MKRATLRRTNLYRPARSRIHLFCEAANRMDRITPTIFALLTSMEFDY